MKKKRKANMGGLGSLAIPAGYAMKARPGPVGKTWKYLVPLISEHRSCQMSIFS